MSLGASRWGAAQVSCVPCVECNYWGQKLIVNSCPRGMESTVVHQSLGDLPRIRNRPDAAAAQGVDVGGGGPPDGAGRRSICRIGGGSGDGGSGGEVAAVPAVGVLTTVASATVAVIVAVVAAAVAFWRLIFTTGNKEAGVLRAVPLGAWPPGAPRVLWPRVLGMRLLRTLSFAVETAALDATPGVHQGVKNRRGA